MVGIWISESACEFGTALWSRGGRSYAIGKHRANGKTQGGLFRHRASMAVLTHANVGMKRTADNLLNRVQFLKLTVDCEACRSWDTNVKVAQTLEQEGR